jgi:hypothetical protein
MLNPRKIVLVVYTQDSFFEGTIYRQTKRRD